jgi:hypothetical protein
MSPDKAKKKIGTWMKESEKNLQCLTELWLKVGRLDAKINAALRNRDKNKQKRKRRQGS